MPNIIDALDQISTGFAAPAPTSLDGFIVEVQGLPLDADREAIHAAIAQHYPPQIDGETGYIPYEVDGTWFAIWGGESSFRTHGFSYAPNNDEYHRLLTFAAHVKIHLSTDSQPGGNSMNREQTIRHAMSRWPRHQAQNNWTVL